jgi:hypothetical protein
LVRFSDTSNGLFGGNVAKFMQSIRIQISDDHFSIGPAAEKHRPVPARGIPIDEFFVGLDDYF